MIVEGAVPGRQNVKDGTVLYKVLWKGYPPEIATWEEKREIHSDFLDEYEADLAAEAELEAEEAAELASGGTGSDSECENEE